MSDLTITPETNEALSKAAQDYAETVVIPYYMDSVDAFAEAYLGASEEGFSTLVTGDAEGLAISVDSKDGSSMMFLNIDLDLPDGTPASIVAPGFYDKKGRPDAESGKYARPVLRALTETEGQGLVADLRDLTEKIPQVVPQNQG